jgi:hypothetical protein
MNRNVILTALVLGLLAPALLVVGCRRHATVPADEARDRTTALPEGDIRRADATDAQWERFGEPVAVEAESVDVADLLARPAAYEGQLVQLQGTVTEVCQESGCWLKLADTQEASEAVFVKFTCPIEGFLIPTDAVGRPAVVQGQVIVEEISEDVARHYAEDGGRSPEEIQRIQGPQRMIRVMSPSARVAMN